MALACSATSSSSGLTQPLGATHDPLELGPSLIAYPVAAGRGRIDVISHDLSTGTKTIIGTHDSAKDKLLAVLPDKQLWLSGDNTVVTVMRDKPAIRIELPAMPPDP